MHYRGSGTVLGMTRRKTTVRRKFAGLGDLARVRGGRGPLPLLGGGDPTLLERGHRIIAHRGSSRPVDVSSSAAPKNLPRHAAVSSSRSTPFPTDPSKRDAHAAASCSCGIGDDASSDGPHRERASIAIAAVSLRAEVALRSRTDHQPLSCLTGQAADESGRVGQRQRPDDTDPRRCSGGASDIIEVPSHWNQTRRH